MEKVVFFGSVARSAGRHDIVPGMGTAAAPGHNMVDVLRRRAAVLAAVAIPSEDGTAVQRHSGLIGHLHEVLQADHRRLGKRTPRRVETPARVVEDFSLAIQYQDQRATAGHNAQRLIAGIEQK